jgi:hypothetical protein
LRFFGLILENIVMVFLGCSFIETAKNATKKIGGEIRKGKGVEKKKVKKKVVFSQLFRPKAFDMDFPKGCWWCFRTPLVEKRTKTPYKKSQHVVAICQSCTSLLICFFFVAPCREVTQKHDPGPGSFDVFD